VSTYFEQEYNPQRVLIYFEKGYKTTFPSLARRGVCAAGADGGGLFKVPRSGSLQISARSALLATFRRKNRLLNPAHRRISVRRSRRFAFSRSFQPSAA
jgi:hypothetical protein